jgi:TonB family protein
MGADMTDWEQWEGRTVEGKYRLRNYLGGSDGRAVFRTGTDEETDAVIKFFAADDAEAEGQRRRWEKARELGHPNLIRIFAAGRTVADGREFFYAVEEFAEENLAQIVPERALTAEEAHGMLGPVVAALEYLHGKGLVHGGIRPANILAARDQVKLSIDSLRNPGEMPCSASACDAPEVAAHGVSPASDVWSLGMTLAEVMTQHVPVWDAARMTAPEVERGIPEPIRGIVQRCLEIDPRKRCGLREMQERLEAGETVAPAIRETAMPAVSPPAGKSGAMWQRWIVPAAVIAVTIFLIARPRLSHGPTGGETSTVQPPVTQQAPVQTVPTERRPAEPEAEKTAAPQPGGMVSGGSEEGGSEAPKDEIVERVMPEVLPSARRTIEGRIRVRVKVGVDANGKVSEARLTDAGPSKYFARVALEGARRWQFAPARDQDEKREWNLAFVFTRTRTEATAARARHN